MTPGCDSREDNNLSSDAEVPTLPAKTLPLSRSRSLKRDIVGTHQAFVFYSLIDVRDGFARDCPHRHPVPSVLALRDGSAFAPWFFLTFHTISAVSGGDAREARRVRGKVAAEVRANRLARRVPWSGLGARVASRDTLPAEGRRRIGPRHGPILSPSPSGVAPVRVASRGHPELSRIIPG